MGERDILGAQLIRRNEAGKFCQQDTNGKSNHQREISVRFFMLSSYLQELATLYEKIKIQQSTLQKGEIQCPWASGLTERSQKVHRLILNLDPRMLPSSTAIVPMCFAVPT